MAPRKGDTWRRGWPAALVFAAALAVYIVTLCPTVFVEGTGENIIAVATLGVPHPPGFPLFCLLGKAFISAVPVGEAAFRVNLFSAVLGASAAAACFLLLSALRIGRLAAGAAALGFAFSGTFWREATIAEVYTLSTALVIVQIGLLLAWRREGTAAPPTDAGGSRGRRGRRVVERAESREGPDPGRFLIWFGLAFGLGLTVHYSHLLLLPGYLAFVAVTDRRILRQPRTLGPAVLAGLAGFSVHVYAPLRSAANPALDWGNPETLGNWWSYLTAAQYRGRMFDLPLSEVLGNLAHFLADLPREITYIGLAAAVGGAVVCRRRDRAVWWLTALTVVVGVVWAVNYDIPWEIEVYYLPVLVALTIWLAFGLEAAATWLRKRSPVASMLVLVVPALAVGMNYARNDLSDQRFVLQNARDILSVIEPESAVILPSTNPTFALLYLTEVEGEAPGVRLWSRHARGVTRTREAVRPAAEQDTRREAQLVRDLIEEGVPVYTVERQPESVLAGLRQIPWRCVYRIVPASQAVEWNRHGAARGDLPLRFDPGRQQIRYGAEQELIVCRYLLVEADAAWQRGDTEVARQGYEGALAVGADLASVAAEVGQRYVEQGRSEEAAAVYERALAHHDDAVLHNRLGAIYGRAGRLEEAEPHFRRALELRPDYADARANLASVYGRKGEVERAISELEAALSEEPDNLQALKNLGVAYVRTGHPEKGREMLERAREIDPTQDEIGEMLSRMGDLPRHSGDTDG